MFEKNDQKTDKAQEKRGRGRLTPSLNPVPDYTPFPKRAQTAPKRHCRAMGVPSSPYSPLSL